METVDREVRIEIDIVECIFTINGLSIQRVDVLENIEKLGDNYWDKRDDYQEKNKIQIIVKQF